MTGDEAIRTNATKSHDCVFKSDWCCQILGSGSNSLNARVLPDVPFFCERLGTRLVNSASMFPEKNNCTSTCGHIGSWTREVRRQLWQWRENGSREIFCLGQDYTTDPARKISHTQIPK